MPFFLLENSKKTGFICILAPFYILVYTLIIVVL